MNRSTSAVLLLGGLLLSVAGSAEARGLGVEVWTDRGNEAVYQPGDGMRVKVRPSEDAYLLVYEIDTEGYVRVLHPHRGRAESIEGGRTLEVPDPEDDVELVVQQTVGQSYIVAIASYEPFRALPWFLRPYSAQEEALGYVGEPEDEEGITAEGRIVGDPFVAMERIRRRVLDDPDDDESFGTSYTTYYTHTEVKYPRYLCYDCHRPNRWAWWDGFDPYYTDCSVFSFRVNWSWYWGPSYWFGHVPYFVYVYRPDCPPRYVRYFESGIWYSAWDGWNRWCELWGNGGLKRYKSPPPPGYVPPVRWKQAAVRLPAERRTPPGFLSGGGRVRDGSGRLPGGRIRSPREEARGLAPDGRTRWTDEGRVRKPDAERAPAVRSGRGERVRDDRGAVSRPDRGNRRPDPVYRPREGSRPPRDSGRQREAGRPAPPRQDPKRRDDPPRREERAPERRREERAPERRRDEGRRISMDVPAWSPAPERPREVREWRPAPERPVEIREWRPAPERPAPSRDWSRPEPREEVRTAPAPPPRPEPAPRVEAPRAEPRPATRPEIPWRKEKR